MRRLREPILMYHHVEPKPFDPKPRFTRSYVSRAEFSDHLDWLAGKGFSAVSLAEAVDRSGGGDRPPGRCLVLTFDDGCQCFLEHIVPELERRKMSATVFAVSSQIGGENAWDRARGERVESLLTVDELRDLASRGFEIGCHSQSHADLTTIAPAELAREVAGAKQDLEAALGSPVATFCYPYAHFNDAVMTAVREAGYRAAVSVHGISGVSARNRFALPRAVVTPGASRLEFQLQATGWYGLWRRMPRLGFLNILRRVRDRS